MTTRPPQTVQYPQKEVVKRSVFFVLSFSSIMKSAQAEHLRWNVCVFPPFLYLFLKQIACISKQVKFVNLA